MVMAVIVVLVVPKILQVLQLATATGVSGGGDVLQSHVSYGLNSGWGGPIGDYIGFWGGPIKGYIANLVQGSC